MARLSTARLLLLLAACGPGKGTAGTESSTTESGTTESGTTGTDTGGATGTPTTGPDACDMFLPPDELGPPVEIKLVHQGTQPLWFAVTGCGGLPQIDILDAGAQVLARPNLDCSPVWCHDFLGLDDCVVGCNDCGVPSLGRIDPGASVVVNWPGTHGVPAQLAAECAPGVNCQRDCLIQTQTEPGEYELRIQAFRGCTGGMCTCDPPSDTCPLYDAVQGTDPVTFSVKLAYPAVTAIELPLTDP